MSESFKFKGKICWYERLTQISAATCCLAMASAPTISLGLSGVLWCEGCSWVPLCQSCVSVLAGTDRLHRNPLRGQSTCFLCCTSFSLAKVGAPAWWRPVGELGQGRCLCGWERRGRAHQESAPGHSEPAASHGIRGALGCARLSARVCLLQLFPNNTRQ